ncbi:acyl-CoA acyltransferase [Rhodopseudomonas pseudopalustris]|uniref:Acyl-CoA acyltransferase n=1 Tax=Rhodopseudomonas pseudopalustris TaxID=1513892 RepID=A0A1H8NHF1_9BRAD|nr:acyl-CoA acyltransferase [Rhodopseudomonas pseudopalustris]SEO28909.1 hypothetical protein SAMN05444123_102104 [Rhodopseudomonas pseudopalustris]
MDPRKVRCREIVEADIEAVSQLLTRGFSGRSQNYWLRGLHRQGQRDVPDGCPRYGYLLENCERPVGVLLLLYTQRLEDGGPSVRCNVSSWYVDPEFRNYATLLTSVAQKNKHVTYINISPATNTWPIIEAQGFRRYCGGMFFSAPLLSRAEKGMTVERVTGASAAVEGLPPADFDLLRSHADYGCLSLVCRVGDEAIPFIMIPKRMKSGRFPMPAMQLVYCRETPDFVRCAGALGRALIWRGRPLVIIDSNGPIAGLSGVYTESRGRKYFKGPNPPRLADLTETELVLYGP